MRERGATGADVSRRRLLAAVAGGPLAAASLAGCTDDGAAVRGSGGATDSATEAPSAPVASARVLVGAGDAPARFDPAVVWLEVGGTVAWRAADGDHTVTAFHPDVGATRRVPEGAEPFDSGVLGPDDAFEVTFDAPGVYDYFCRRHGADGAVGCVVVGEPEPAGEPGLTVPGPDAVAPEALREVNERARAILASASAVGPAADEQRDEQSDGENGEGDDEAGDDGGGDADDGRDAAAELDADENEADDPGAEGDEDGDALDDDDDRPWWWDDDEGEDEEADEGEEDDDDDEEGEDDDDEDESEGGDDGPWWREVGDDDDDDADEDDDRGPWWRDGNDDEPPGRDDGRGRDR